MTPLEEVHKETAARLAKLAADKARFTRLAEFYKTESAHYLKKADDCDEVTLAVPGAPGQFGGL